MRDLKVKGEIPSAANVPPGCRFHPRCFFASPECAQLPEPELEAADGGSESGHFVACRRFREL
jgi:peptide/nickel transport system ATP-binding protein